MLSLDLPKKKSSVFVVASLICASYFIVEAFITNDYQDRFIRWEVIGKSSKSDPPSSACKDQYCRPSGTEALPRGIVTKTSNLEMQPFWVTSPTIMSSEDRSASD